MKPFSWLWLGVGTLALFGLILLVLGFLFAGADFVEVRKETETQAWSKELEEKVAKIRSRDHRIQKEKDRLLTQEGIEHRVMVSRTLVFLPERKDEPVQALTKDLPIVTADGIQVAWKLQYKFDPADPQIAELDSDGDGFTNREEFEAKTSPRDKENSPAKESKLRVRHCENVPMILTFPEKSIGLFTLRFQVGNKRAEFKGKAGDHFWILAGPGSIEIFADETKAISSRGKRKESNGWNHLVPVSIASYQEKIEMVKDASTGVEVEMDNSTLTIRREDALKYSEELPFGSSKKSKFPIWDVGEIRLFSPVEGVGEIGPLQLGQNFEYEGRVYSIQKKESGKILLKSQDPEAKEFWVPPETSSTHSSAGSGM